MPASRSPNTSRWRSTTAASPIAAITRPSKPRPGFLCLLAGYLKWHLRRAWAPLLFDDQSLAQERKTRDPVAPAKPSPAAKRKKATRRTEDGLPLHSFETLIAELATRCRNTCRIDSDPSAPSVPQLTQPTETQRRARNLIDMFPVPTPA